MNVKNKIFAIAMSFVICFCTVGNSFCNDKERIIEPLVFDGGIISAPMVATIGSLAVASGIVLSSNDDLYDIAYIFYQKYKDNWEDIKLVFDTCVSIGANKVVTVGEEFLTLVKDCFDGFTEYLDKGIIKLELTGGFWNLGQLQYNQDYNGSAYHLGIKKMVDGTDFSINNLDFKYLRLSPNQDQFLYQIFCNGVFVTSLSFNINTLYSFATCLNGTGILLAYTTLYQSGYYNTNTTSDISKYINGTIDIPYKPGSYSPSGVLDKPGVDINVPSKLKDLIGVGADAITGNPSYDLPIDGAIELPFVSNPSIDTAIEGTFNPSLDSDVPIDKPGGIVFPPIGGGLDFTPITQGSFTDKFPFSLAKDIKNIISVFDVEPKAPKFTVPIVSEELEVDLTQFNIWASIIRFFVLIGFIIALINITRKVIG